MQHVIHATRETCNTWYMKHLIHATFSQNLYHLFTGHPTIITEFAEDDTDISNYFGLIKCRLLPPKRLLHPVAPVKLNNKLLFPLCYKCAKTEQQTRCHHTDKERAIDGTWVSVELLEALAQGYSILKLHEVWHFPSSAQYDEAFSLLTSTCSCKSKRRQVGGQGMIWRRPRRSST